MIGGGGRLPDILADALPPDARLFAPEGTVFGSGARQATPFRVERLGELFEALHAAGVTEVILAGAMRRPALDPDAFDAFTATLVPRLDSAIRGGDDALLRTVVAIFEEAGFTVVPAQSVVPALLPPVGVLTSAQPSEQDDADAARGFEILRILGPADVGQACVVAQGQALAIEAAPGTDWMLASLAGEVPGRPPRAAGSGVLCKGPKPGQDRRVDLPTIGRATVAAVAGAGLAGIVVEAGGVLVLDREEVVADADRAGVFLWVRGS